LTPTPSSALSGVTLTSVIVLGGGVENSMSSLAVLLSVLGSGSVVP
jgi:hypothetical protein